MTHLNFIILFVALGTSLLSANSKHPHKHLIFVDAPIAKKRKGKSILGKTLEKLDQQKPKTRYYLEAVSNAPLKASSQPAEISEIAKDLQTKIRYLKQLILELEKKKTLESRGNSKSPLAGGQTQGLQHQELRQEFERFISTPKAPESKKNLHKPIPAPGKGIEKILQSIY